jgi:hypothetical protein
MVSLDKIQRGAARFLDAEIFPKVDGKDKWIISAAGTLYLAKLPALVNTLNTNPAIKALGIVSEDGQSIDLDALIGSVKPASKQAPVTFKIPLGGAITVTDADLDILHRYIMQA